MRYIQNLTLQHRVMLLSNVVFNFYISVCNKSINHICVFQIHKNVLHCGCVYTLKLQNLINLLIRKMCDTPTILCIYIYNYLLVTNYFNFD